MITYEFFMKNLNIGKQRAMELCDELKNSSVKNVLMFKENVLLQKIEFYKQYNISIREFEKFPQLLAFDCVSNSPTSVKSKLDFFHSLGFSDAAIKCNPNLLGLDCTSEDASNERSVIAKINFFVHELGFDIKTLQSNPKLFSLDTVSDSPTSLRGKLKFYKDELGIDINAIKSHPNLLNYDTVSNNPTSIKSKVNFFKKYLGMTPEDLRSNPSVLGLDCDTNPNNKKSILFKIKKLNEIGFDNEFIRKNSKILTMPAEDIKCKYALWCIIFPDKKFLHNSSKWYIPSLEKTYARYMFFKNERSDKKLVPYTLEMCESRFFKFTNQNSAILMEKYPLDEKAKSEIFEEYKNLKLEPVLKNSNE